MNFTKPQLREISKIYKSGFNVSIDVGMSKIMGEIYISFYHPAEYRKRRLFGLASGVIRINKRGSVHWISAGRKYRGSDMQEARTLSQLVFGKKQAAIAPVMRAHFESQQGEW